MQWISWKCVVIYLRGWLMLWFIGLFVIGAAGLWAWATWLDSIVTVFWFGLAESWTFVSIGLFWDIPITSIGSDIAALSEWGVLCWTILIPPALTAIRRKTRRKRRIFAINNFWRFDELEFVFVQNRCNSYLIYSPAGARPATLTLDSSSDILTCKLPVFVNKNWVWLWVGFFLEFLMRC